jgi:hypothetical protein
MTRMVLRAFRSNGSHGDMPLAQGLKGREIAERSRGWVIELSNCRRLWGGQSSRGFLGRRRLGWFLGFWEFWSVRAAGDGLGIALKCELFRFLEMGVEEVGLRQVGMTGYLGAVQ